MLVRQLPDLPDLLLHPCFAIIHIQVLQYTAGHINYGGRVTDDWDRRCLMNILNDFYSNKVLAGHHTFSPSGTYHQLDPETTRHKVCT